MLVNVLNVLKIPKTTLNVSQITKYCSKQNVVKIKNMDDFNKIVKNSKVPVIVDFYANWCRPCSKLTPRLESVVAESKGKVILAKVDVDEITDLALNYNVGPVPVLVAMKNGAEEKRLIGLHDTDILRKWIEELTK